MKVKDILNHYSMASNAEVQVEITTGPTKGVHKFSNESLRQISDWSDAPILSRTVGMIKIIDNVLTITAH